MSTCYYKWMHNWNNSTLDQLKQKMKNNKN